MSEKISSSESDKKLWESIAAELGRLLVGPTVQKKRVQLQPLGIIMTSTRNNRVICQNGGTKFPFHSLKVEETVVTTRTVGSEGTLERTVVLTEEMSRPNLYPTQWTYKEVSGEEPTLTPGYKVDAVDASTRNVPHSLFMLSTPAVFSDFLGHLSPALPPEDSPRIS